MSKCAQINVLEGNIRQKLHGATLFTSSFGRKCTVEKGFYRPSTQVWEDDKGEIVHFLRCTSFFCVSVHIFGRNCTCVRSRKKKSSCPLFSYTIFACAYLQVHINGSDVEVVVGFHIAPTHRQLGVEGVHSAVLI